MAGVRALSEMHGFARFEQEGNLLARIVVTEDVNAIKDGVSTIVITIKPEDAVNMRIVVEDADLLHVAPRKQGNRHGPGTPLTLEAEQI